MSLAEKIQAKKISLKHTQTTVKTPEGTVYVEDGSETRMLSSTCLGFVADYKPDMQIGYVLPGLCVGSQDVALDCQVLRQNNITHILSLGIEVRRFPFFEYRLVKLLDLPSERLSQVLDECIQFIDDAKSKGGTVYVHCNAGVSRSASIVIAYLIKREGYEFTEAYNHVKQCRPSIQPNAGFIAQLKNLE